MAVSRNFGPCRERRSEINPGDGLSVFDLEALRERLDEDEEAMKEMIQLFFSQTPILVERSRSAASAENWEEAAMSSHTLKGAFATFGAEVLAQVAEEMERIARGADKNAFTRLLQRLDAGIIELKRRVKELGY